MSDFRVFLKRTSSGEEREIRGTVLVGRDVPDGLKIDEDGVSRRHASLSVENDMLFVEDTGSRNGTFVNGERITAKRHLRPGDLVRFEKAEFQVHTQDPNATVIPVPVATSESAQVRKAIAGSWVDWNLEGGNGTERLTPDQLQEFLRKSKERRAQQTAVNHSDPCLRVTSGAGADRIIALTENGEPNQEWTVGRNEDCAVRLDAAGISEWHAKIVREGRRWKLIDAISSNGSFVNDLRIGMSYLESGDSLRFGSIECVIHLPKSAGSGAALPGAGGGAPQSRRTVVIVIVIVVVAAAALGAYFLFRPAS